VAGMSYADPAELHCWHPPRKELESKS